MLLWRRMVQWITRVLASHWLTVITEMKPEGRIFALNPVSVNPHTFPSLFFKSLKATKPGVCSRDLITTHKSEIRNVDGGRFSTEVLVASYGPTLGHSRLGQSHKTETLILFVISMVLANHGKTSTWEVALTFFRFRISSLDWQWHAVLVILKV